MKKNRFWYWIISIIVSFFGILYTILYPSKNDFFLYILIAIIIIPNFRMRRNERNLIMSIMGSYAIDCNAVAYLDNLTKYYNDCYFSKKNKHYHNTILAMINMDLGNFDKAKELLLSLQDYVDEFPDFQKYTYYRAWTTYYYEFGETKKYKVLLDEMKRIVDSTNGSLKMQLLSNYNLVEAKYFICEGIYLDKAKNLYEEILSMNTAPILRLSSHFYLGVINFKTGNLNKARDEFKYVALSEKKVKIVEKSNKYLDIIALKLDNK